VQVKVIVDAQNVLAAAVMTSGEWN